MCDSQRKLAFTTGYSNLMAHLSGKHSGYEASTVRPLQAFEFVLEEEKNMFQWIQWIFVRNMPLHEVEDSLTRPMGKLRPVTVKTVRKFWKELRLRYHKISRNSSRKK
ncbi:hypothetical protein PHMEG_0002279 [Phytophthora megakarya]|uniref:Uncharacterized protein n=1 Tax=Phytophthora megakarya TaxID=4795 RepID=A0A225X102_9STRA|nr:hypothetical protein PHMEG_0002279 [Phytophthora megakarya]